MRLQSYARLIVMLTGLTAGTMMAGSSIRLSTEDVSAPLPDRSSPLPWRVEFYLHDWAEVPTNHSRILSSGALGLDAYFLIGEQVFLLLYNTRESGASDQCQFPVSGLESKAVYVRYQHDPANRTDVCEAWDGSGKLFFSRTITYTSKSDMSATGFTVGGNGGENRFVAFARVKSTLVPPNSKVPVTADNTDTLLHWKFDGNLQDASGNGRNGTISSGSPQYASSPNQLAQAVIRTANAPAWSNWVSIRAGHSNVLDGTNSYSQADASASVTCVWQQISGPSTVFWSSQTSCQPSISGLVFGDYEFQLTVTDSSGQTSTTTQHIGSVAYDSKGIVIHSNPDADTIYGPMIAFGRNPWGYMDERGLALVAGQQTYFDGGAWPTNPSWNTPGAGTVSYIFDGGASVNTTLAGAGIASATSTTFDVSDASKIDLSTLPTWLMIGDYWGSREIIRVCSTTGTTGAQTLTVCYDGRGLSGRAFSSVVAAQSWPAGTNVMQMKITGTGTNFAADATSPLCPAGVPGPAGRVTYSTGTVTLSGGSTTLTGSGTNWTPQNGVAAGSIVRITASHGGGLPFVFWSEIEAVSDPEHLVLKRPAPGDIDATGFAYQVVAPRYAVLGFTAPDGSEQLGYQNLHGCESESAAYGAPTHDIAGMGSPTPQSGKTYSYLDGLGAQGSAGPNFYGSGLALRAFYYRSGLQQALDLANRMDNLWVKHPEIGGGWLGGLILNRGGPVVGAIANLVLNPNATITWADVRRFVSGNASVATSNCDAWDSRESGYVQGWTALAALFDPDNTGRTAARTTLTSFATRNNNCRSRNVTGGAPAEANSWSNGFLFNTGSPALTLTNGSAMVTGTGLPSSLCAGIASGTVNVTQGSAEFTGTGLVNGNQIVITGTRNGELFVGFYRFAQTGGTSGTFSVLWQGDTGTATYMILNNDYMGVIGTSNSDPQLTKNWACIWNSPTQITLNRSWDGPNTSEGHIYSYVLAGYGQQPFMLGIQTTAMRWASLLDATLGTDFGGNAVAAATWIHDYGYDPVTQGVHYGRVYGACEPPGTPPSGSTFDFANIQCSFGLGAIPTGRVNTAEVSSALRSYYEAVPNEDRKNWGDTAYGSVWGYAPWTTGGAYADSNYVQWELSDNVGMRSYKWPGFFFGMGMAHQWPAVRQGPAEAPEMRELAVSFNAASDPRTARWKMTLTLPSGKEIVKICTSSPCTATIDLRQGSPLVRWYYLDANDRVVGKSDATVVAVE